MFLVVEEEDSICSRLDASLLFISKLHDMLRSHTRNFYNKRNTVKNICQCVQLIGPIPVTRFVVGNDSRTKKNSSPSKKSAGKDKKRKTREATLKLFCKRKKSLLKGILLEIS